jgi:kumamolisin
MPPRRLPLAPPSRMQQTEPPQVASAYQFPADANGEGQCVGIIELGGGFYEEDLKAYFAHHGLPQPEITVVEVDDQKNSPADLKDITTCLELEGIIPEKKPGEKPAQPAPAVLNQVVWTIETTMDIELVGRFANRARIVVYLAPNTSQGKYHAFTTALTDRKNHPSVISCSWGAHENLLTRGFMELLDNLFQEAALKGVTICCSSGDDGNSAGPDGTPQVHFPASSPHVLACGGTHLVISDTGVEETIWSETVQGHLFTAGGGASAVFDRPEWQHHLHVKHKAGKRGRGVPDVAGKADLADGYCILVGGNDIGMGGTSAAAPMWAALTALLNQKLGKPVGYLNPLLYAERFRHAIKDITRGPISKGFTAGPGWNPATGLGSPRGNDLLAALHPDKS